MQTKRKIIIDVDTGVDDALALLLAAKMFPDQVIGITTCGGNISLDLATQNTLAILDLAEVKWPVYKGSAKNISKKNFTHAYDYHGQNGLGNINLLHSRKIEKSSAIDFIIDSAKRYSGDLDFICLAPATNLASSLAKEPAIKGAINRVVMMGGAVKVPGNQSSHAEFNFYQDTLAVKMIFDTINNIELVPLDVTNQCLIEKESIVLLKDSRIAEFACQLVENWYNYFGSIKNRKFELYDPLAIASIDHDFVTYAESRFSITQDGPMRGALIKGSKKLKYASEVNSQKFIHHFIETINSL